MRYTMTTVFTAVATGLALFAGAGAANAAPTPGQATVQQQIDGILAKHPDAVKSGKSTVSWDHGAVTLRLAGASGLESCGSGQFCLWQDFDFGGRMLSWKVSLNCQTVINLPDYGFNDQASSWANNSDHIIDVYNDVNRGGGVIWTELKQTNSSSVGTNDQASSLFCNA